MTLENTVFTQLGNLLYANGDFKNAERAYSFAVEYEEDLTTLYNRAITYYELSLRFPEERGYYLAKAKEDLEKVVSTDPNNIKARYRLALVYSSLGEIKKAAEEYNFLLELPDFSERFTIMSMDIYVEIEEAEESAYSLFSDPLLIQIYDLLRDYPLEEKQIEMLRKKYGGELSLAAARFLQHLYERIFEKKELDKIVGKNDRLKWEAIILLYTRGVNDDTIDIIRKSAKFGYLKDELLPPYTRAVMKTFREKVLKVPSEKIKFSKLIEDDIEKIKTLDALIEDFSNATLTMEEVISILSSLEIMDNSRVLAYLSKADVERMKKIMKEGYGDFSFVVYFLKKLRVAMIKYFAKKLKALYNDDERYRILKNLLLNLSMEDEERYKILRSI